MRIAQVAPLYEAVPPGAYGGTERVIAGLCDGLVAQGHEVTLFAPETSETAAVLEAYGEPLRTRFSGEELVNLAPHLHLEMFADVYERSDDFDVVHSHLDIWTFPFTRALGRAHSPDDARPAGPGLPSRPDAALRLGAAGLDQRRPASRGGGPRPHLGGDGLQRARPLGVRRGSHDSDGYLAFVGRIAEEKGPLAAIEIARRSGLPLRMAAKVDPLDEDYYEQEVKPHMGHGVDFIGEIDELQKPEFYAGARATLFPSDWPEPFGLVMIESLAAGTPVIALRRGSVPEVIVDGVTGFICDDVDEMAKAAERIGEIDPEECRRHADRFSAEAMCRGYTEVYEALVDGRPTRAELEGAPPGLRFLPSEGRHGGGTPGWGVVGSVPPP